MEQILVRYLPDGTKAALRDRASRHHRSVEAEARDILTSALDKEPPTIVDLIACDDDVVVEFEPERLGVEGRVADL